MKQAVITSARLLQEGIDGGGFRYQAAMLTLTYRKTEDWQPKHVSTLTNNIRMRLKRRYRDDDPRQRFRCVWVHELQKRGTPHYHLLCWFPAGFRLPKLDKAGLWPHGMTKMEFARNAVGYLAKYASKGTGEHCYPEGARLHGNCGLDASQRMQRRWWRFPLYVRLRFTNWRDDVVRAPGGGFLVKSTGEVASQVWKFAGLVREGPADFRRTVSVIKYEPGPDWLAFFESYCPWPRMPHFSIEKQVQAGTAGTAERHRLPD